jgi:iron complex transport system substrate-binding protein
MTRWIAGVLALAAVAIGVTARPMPPPAAQERPPRRIISLVPSVTEMIFAIGGGNEIVAVSSYDRFPQAVEALPKVGALIDPDFERILSLRPDLVVVFGSQSELIARLERVRVPIFNYRHTGLADIADTIAALGERLGRQTEARREVERLEREFDDVRRRVAGRARPRTVLVFGRELGTLRGIFASGGVGFMHDMLELAGGTDLFADVPRQSVQASTELLIARAPEVIIETYSRSGWTPERVAAEVAVWQGLPTLPAVRNGRVHILTDEVVLVPGPRVTEGVRLIARVLHPDAFR